MVGGAVGGRWWVVRVTVREWLEMGGQVGGEVGRGGKNGLLIDWSVERWVFGCMARRVAGWLEGLTAWSALCVYMYGFMNVWM